MGELQSGLQFGANAQTLFKFQASAWSLAGAVLYAVRIGSM
jgi:hypothetical protein